MPQNTIQSNNLCARFITGSLWRALPITELPGELLLPEWRPLASLSLAQGWTGEITGLPVFCVPLIHPNNLADRSLAQYKGRTEPSRACLQIRWLGKYALYNSCLYFIGPARRRLSRTAHLLEMTESNETEKCITIGICPDYIFWRRPRVKRENQNCRSLAMKDITHFRIFQKSSPNFSTTINSSARLIIPCWNTVVRFNKRRLFIQT